MVVHGAGLEILCWMIRHAVCPGLVTQLLNYRCLLLPPTQFLVRDSRSHRQSPLIKIRLGFLDIYDFELLSYLSWDTAPNFDRAEKFPISTFRDETLCYVSGRISCLFVDIFGMRGNHRHLKRELNRCLSSSRDRGIPTFVVPHTTEFTR
jgi:hypothetical protein